MKYIIETSKTVEKARVDLEASVKKHSFGVLHTYNIKETLHSKGVDFDNECQILEICNPKKAKEVMDADMEMNMFLPCRISVYTHNGITKIGMVKPTAMLKMLSDSTKIASIALEVEASMIKMIDEVK